MEMREGGLSRGSSSPTGLRTHRRAWKRRLLQMAAGAAALGLLWVLYVQVQIHSVPVQPAEGRADIGIVLGAALWNNEPSPALKERLDRGLELYRDHRVDRLLVTGGLDYNGSTIPEAEGMKNYLVSHGVPADRIVLEPLARSTYENLLYSKAIMDRNGWKRAVIITHEYHGARAYDIARFLKMEDPRVSLVDSRVMWMPWHKARETLAYTKWMLDKFRYTITSR